MEFCSNGVPQNCVCRDPNLLPPKCVLLKNPVNNDPEHDFTLVLLLVFVYFLVPSLLCCYHIVKNTKKKRRKIERPAKPYFRYAVNSSLGAASAPVHLGRGLYVRLPLRNNPSTTPQHILQSSVERSHRILPVTPADYSVIQIEETIERVRRNRDSAAPATCQPSVLSPPLINHSTNGEIAELTRHIDQDQNSSSYAQLPPSTGMRIMRTIPEDTVPFSETPPPAYHTATRRQSSLFNSAVSNSVSHAARRRSVETPPPSYDEALLTLLQRRNDN